MAFSLPCTNKGCGKIMSPYIDTNDDKVYCSLCDKEIINITPFIKNQMKMNKQFRQKQTKPFSVKCQNCKKEDRPKISGKDVVCAHCNKPLTHLSEPFKIMLREKLKTTDLDV